MDESYAVGECEIKLLGWDRPRRFVAVREQIRETKPSVGKKLIDLPEYTFRVFVTSLASAEEAIWRDYQRRGPGVARRPLRTPNQFWGDGPPYVDAEDFYPADIDWNRVNIRP